MRITGGTVLSMRPGDAPDVRDVCIDGDRIAERADGEVIDASGCYVMPGLVQTHIHLVQTIFRGLAEELTLLEWLRDRIWPLEAAHDEASLRATARLGLLDLLATGTTTILDMGTTHGGDIIAEELVASGIRARFGQTMMDGGDGVPKGLRETTSDSLHVSARLVMKWNEAADGRIGYAYAPRFALSPRSGLGFEREVSAAPTPPHGLYMHIPHPPYTPPLWTLTRFCSKPKRP